MIDPTCPANSFIHTQLAPRSIPAHSLYFTSNSLLMATSFSTSSFFSPFTALQSSQTLHVIQPS